MKKIKITLKAIIAILIVSSCILVPVLDCAKAMSYGYDFWKNIIPSAEGIAHQDTYYAENFPYYKNNEYEACVTKLKTLVNDNHLTFIKETILDKEYKDILTTDYDAAINTINSYALEQSIKDELKQLLLDKKEYEADPNLYKKISFDGIADLEVYKDKIYLLATPTSETKITNISGSQGITNVTQLIVINSDLEWELCMNEFVINDEVKSSFDEYYQWYRLRFVSVATGTNHTIAVDSSGNLWSWGNNNAGQLGLDPTTHPQELSPYQVTWIGDSNAVAFKSVYAVDDTSYAIDDKGKLYSWGSNDNNLLGLTGVNFRYQITELPLSKTSSITVAQLAVASDHIYAIDGSDNIWAWGNGNTGILGEESISQVTAPKKIINVEENATNNRKPDITEDQKLLGSVESIVTNATHTAVIDSDGNLWIWGANDFGQLGINTAGYQYTPAHVDIRKNEVRVKVLSVALGSTHTIVVDNVGTLWGWGANDETQLGKNGLANQALPYIIDEETEYKTVAAYGKSSYAIDNNGHLVVFGNNQNHVLGLGDNNSPSVELSKVNSDVVFTNIVSSNDGSYGIDADYRLWVWGSSDVKLSFGSTDDISIPKYHEGKLVLKNIAIKELSNSDIYKRAVYIASSTDENVASVYLRKAEGVTVLEDFVYIADTENSRILKFNKTTRVVEDVCLTPDDSTFKNLSLDSSVTQDTTARQFKPTKLAVASTGLVYCIASQVYEGIIEFNKAGNFNRYLGKNEVVVNPIKSALQDFLSEAQLATFALTLPPLFTNINIDSDGFIYATSYPDADDPTSKNMVKSINTSGKDVMKRNGYVKPDGDAVYLTASTDANAILGSSNLVDVAINDAGNFTIVDEVRGRLFTYDNEGNLLYIAGAQPGGNKQTSTGGLSENIIKPVALDYFYRSYINANNQVVEEELIIVADQFSKSLMFYETTEFGKLVNQATTAYAKGVDTAEKAYAVREIWLKVIKMNTNYELAYLGIGKCLLVESDYVDDKDEQVELYQEAMKNFELAHSSIYYSKAYSRYRDQILKDNFNYIMAGVIIAFVGITAIVIVVKIRKRNALRAAGKEVEGDDE